jgi:Subtilisin-like serine proteases
VRVFNNNGVFVWASSLVSAVEECVDSGANVVNMSLGGGGFAQFERDAYNRIYEEDGVLLVAAAGNGGNTAFSYPASYPAVMSVAAVDSDGFIASFSQRNSQVEIAAPGVGVLSTVTGGGYRRFDGTSMACPHVAGVAALVWSNFPQKSAAEIRQALTKSATDLGPSGRDNIYGYGLVQADRAYQLLNGDLTLNPTAAPTPELPCFDSPAGWFDSDGETYNCQWYSRFGRCRLYGSRFENPDNGKTANEACCACGGGQRGQDHSETGKPSSLASSLPSQSPPGTKSQTPSARPTTLPSSVPTESKLPTSKPTRSGTSSSRPSSDPSLNTTPAPTAVPNESTCTDTKNWYDSRGMRFNCNFYAQRRRRCRFAGNFFRNFDQTAKEACCVCGDGTTSNRTLLV